MSGVWRRLGRIASSDVKGCSSARVKAIFGFFSATSLNKHQTLQFSFHDGKSGTCKKILLAKTCSGNSCNSRNSATHATHWFHMSEHTHISWRPCYKTISLKPYSLILQLWRTTLENGSADFRLVRAKFFFSSERHQAFLTWSCSDMAGFIVGDLYE